MKRAFAVIAVVTASLSLLAAPAAKKAPKKEKPPGLILDQEAYFRHFFTFAPPAVNPDNFLENCKRDLDERYFKGYERRMKKHFMRQGHPKDHWMKKPIVMGSSNMFQFDNLRVHINMTLKTPFPPTDWMKADFVDGDWARQLSLFRTDYKLVPQIRAGYYRTRFQIDDPSKIPLLKLAAEYRGGIRVFLNGEEIGRKHMPKGPVTEETYAELYPLETYLLHEGEYPKNWKRHRKIRGKFLLAPELSGPWETLGIRVNPKSKWRTPTNGVCLNRTAYDRITELRQRKIAIDIPGAKLKKGENILAVEVRASLIHHLGVQFEEVYKRNATWSHGGLQGISLLDPSRKTATTMKRQPGVQVWVEDIHRRMYNKEFCEVSQTANVARIAGARNGTFAAQIVLSTDKELKGLKVSTTAFKKAPIKTEIFYPIPHVIKELAPGNRGRRVGNSPSFSIFNNFIKERFGCSEVPYYEHLGKKAPAVIEADTCYPAWIRVRIPENTRPGTYRTQITVEADGMAARTVPLMVTVADWRIPDPKDFTIIAGMEPCPYASAREYKVDLWSEKHFALLDKTFSHLKRIDNDWLIVPVLAHTEFGNGEDSMVRITRKKDGSYAADFTVLDKYLDLTIRHVGKPLVVSFTMMHAGNPGDGRMKLPDMDVPILDEASGKRELLAVDGRLAPAKRRAFWKFISTSIYAHMKARGLGDATYWGYTWDGNGSAPDLYPMLAEFVPQVHWTKGSHKGRPTRYYKALSTVYNGGISIGFGSRKGWKQMHHWLTYPRFWGTVIDCSDYSPPFSFRMLSERALAAGSRGFSRMGVDYWGKIYLTGMKKHTYAVGVPNLFILWPGKEGPETSSRYEILVEGMQETEARIFLEQAMEKLTDEKYGPLKKRINAFLNRRLTEIMLDSPAWTNPALVDLCSVNWQRRSRELYAAAAEVADIVSLDLDQTLVRREVPSRSLTPIHLNIRNWTAAPREWTVAAEPAKPLTEAEKRRQRNLVLADTPPTEWIKFNTATGKSNAPFTPLTVTVDTSKIDPGKTARGLVRFTDKGTGRSESVLLNMTVGKAFTLLNAPSTVNVDCGETVQRTFTLANSATQDLEFNVALTEGPPTRRDSRTRRYIDLKPGPVVPWVKAEPATGKVAPGAKVAITLTITPNTRERLTQVMTLDVAEKGGLKVRPRMVVQVLPEACSYACRPKGEAVTLESVSKDCLRSHSDGHRGSRARLAFWKPHPRWKKFTIGIEHVVYKNGFYPAVNHRTVLNIEGKGFKAFAAEVGPSGGMSSKVSLPLYRGTKLHYEIYVDGKLACHSGLMELADSPLLLVAEGLEKAREIHLVSRISTGANNKRIKGLWGDPMFYK